MVKCEKITKYTRSLYETVNKDGEQSKRICGILKLSTDKKSRKGAIYMNNNNFQFGREDYLDFLCANYYAVREFCLDYDLILPLSEDLGFIRNYLDDNLLEVLECVFGWKNLREMESVLRSYNEKLKKKGYYNYGKNKRRYN